MKASKRSGYLLAVLISSFCGSAVVSAAGNTFSLPSRESDAGQEILQRLGTTVEEFSEYARIPLTLLQNPSYGSWRNAVKAVNGQNVNTIEIDVLKESLDPARQFGGSIYMTTHKEDRDLINFRYLNYFTGYATQTFRNFSSTNYCASENPDARQEIPFNLNNLHKPGTAQDQTLYVTATPADAMVMVMHGYNALGMTDPALWTDNTAEWIDRYGKIYIVLEPNYRSKSFLRCMKTVGKIRKKISYMIPEQHSSMVELHRSLYDTVAEAQADAVKAPTDKSAKFRNALANMEKKAVGGSKFTYKEKTASGTLKIRSFSYKTDTLLSMGNPILSEDQELKIDTRKADNAEVIPSATVYDYAAKKMLPAEELYAAGFYNGIFYNKDYGPVMGIEMHTKHVTTDPAVDAGSVFYRYRTSMDSKQPGDNRFPPVLFSVDKNVPDAFMDRTIFGLEKLSLYENVGALYFVEGESDTLSMRHNGLPALGLPGTTNWDESWNTHLEKIERIYVSVEDDEGGDHFLDTVLANSFGKNTVLIDFTTSEDKDPSDLHIALQKSEDSDSEAQKQFVSRIQDIVEKGSYMRLLKPFFEVFREENTEYYKRLEAHFQSKNAKKDSGMSDKEWRKMYQPKPNIDFYNLFKSYKEADEVFLEEI